MSRERLTRLFWPDDEEERAKKALAQAIYALRRDLQDDGAIEGTRDLTLNADVISSDVAEFASLTKAGRLEDAAALYVGGFLDGFHLVGAADFERWVEEERSALQAQYTRTVERLAMAADTDGHTERAVSWWRALTSIDPLNAQTAVRYMHALDAAGQRSAALTHARIYETLIAQELDLPPDRAVIALAEELRARPERAVAVAPTPEVVPEGVERSPETRPAPVLEAAPRGMPAPAETEAAAQLHTGPRPRSRVAMGMVAAAMVALTVSAMLYVRRSNATEPVSVLSTRHVTADAGLEVDPALSPDGRFLAYAGGEESALRIFVRQIDGGSPIQVSGGSRGEHRRPRWSPDGSRLIFQTEEGLWVIPALGGTARLVVKDGRYPEWSSSGSEIAWTIRDSVFAQPLDGGSRRLIGLVPAAHSPVWSPDGARVAVSSDSRGFVYGVSSPSAAPNTIGAVGGGKIYVLPASGGAATEVVGGIALNTSPAWLGDSRRFAFVSNRDGVRDIYVQSLASNGAAEGVPVRMTTGLDPHTISSTTDGRSLAVSVFRQKANLWQQTLSDTVISTRSALPITSGTQAVEAIDLSPDGRWLAYDSDRDGKQSIYRIAADGSGTSEQLVTGNAQLFHPAWSPDGSSLAYQSLAGLRVQVAVVELPGTSPAYLRFVGWSGDLRFPQWRRGGRALLVEGVGDSAGIFSVARDGANRWLAPNRIASAEATLPTESPDGTQLLYFSRRLELSVFAYARGESTKRVLASRTVGTGLVPYYARWMPDGKSVLVKARDAQDAVGLWQLPIDGGPPRLRIRFDEARRPSARHEFATDGRRVFFTLADRTADVWVLTLR